MLFSKYWSLKHLIWSSKWRCHFSREALFLGQIGHRINKLKSRRILAILLSFFYLFRNFLFKKIERHMWFQKYFGSTMKHWHVFLTLRSRHADTGVVILDCATRWLFIEYLADYSQIYFRLLIPSFTLFLAKGKYLSTAELEHHVSTVHTCLLGPEEGEGEY